MAAQARYWLRPLLNGRMEGYWSNGETHVHFHAEARRATEVAQKLRDIHGEGPSTPQMLEPRFGRLGAAEPHPDQQSLDVEKAGMVIA